MKVDNQTRFIPLDFAPGIVRDETQKRAEGKWWDCDKVRFREGRPESIGGWRKTGTVLGTYTTKIHYQNGRLNAGVVGMVGSGDAPYSINLIPTGSDPPVSTTATKINPEAFTVSLAADPLTGDGTTPNLTLTVPTAGDISYGDAVTISGATTFAGIPVGELNRTFYVIGLTAGVATLNNPTGYVYAAGTGGGAAVVVSVSGWKHAAYPTNGIWAYNWSFAEFGGDIVFAYEGGPIFYRNTDPLETTGCFYLKKSSATYPSVVGGLGLTANSVPLICTGVSVGEDRSIIAFGTNGFGSTDRDLMLVRWSDQENPCDWEPRENNTAGEQSLTWGTQIKYWLRTKRETLIWTDTSLISMKWIGAPYYYRFDKVADGLSISSFGCACVAGDSVYWSDSAAFWRYDGVAKKIPCPVLGYILADMPTISTPYQFAGVNPQYNEVWWFYQSSTAPTTLLCDKYVAYNHQENLWYYGTMNRSCWTHAPSVSGAPPIPLLITSDGTNFYIQEWKYADHNGTTASNIAAYIESGGLDLGEGEVVMHCSRVIPDHGLTGAAINLTYTIKKRDFPLKTWSTAATLTVASTDGQKDIRVRAREVALRLASSANDGKWRSGRPQLEAQADGRR